MFQSTNQQWCLPWLCCPMLSRLPWVSCESFHKPRVINPRSLLSRITRPWNIVEFKSSTWSRLFKKQVQRVKAWEKGKKDCNDKNTGKKITKTQSPTNNTTRSPMVAFKRWGIYGIYMWGHVSVEMQLVHAIEVFPCFSRLRQIWNILCISVHICAYRCTSVHLSMLPFFSSFLSCSKLSWRRLPTPCSFTAPFLVLHFVIPIWSETTENDY